MLQVDDLRFSYRRGREVLRGVAFTVEAGDILCLLGSTAPARRRFWMPVGAFETRIREIFSSTAPIEKLSVRQRARFMAYVPQSTNIAFPYKAREVVMMGRVSPAPGAGHSRAR